MNAKLLAQQFLPKLMESDLDVTPITQFQVLGITKTEVSWERDYPVPG